MARRTFEAAATVTDEAAQIVEGIIEQNQQGDPVGDAMGAPVIDETGNALLPIEVSTNAGLSGSLRGAANLLDNAATQYVRENYPEATGIEQLALVKVEAFRQVSSFDLMGIVLRVHYLRQIQTMGLIAAHPGRYTSLSDMANENGVATSDMLFMLDLVNVVFPYVQNTMEIPIPEFYGALGKSKLKEIMPVLKALVTGDNPDAGTTREAVERLIADALAGMRTAPTAEEARAAVIVENPNATEADRTAAREVLQRRARRRAVDHLVDIATNLPTNEVRRTLRPNGTPPVDLAVVTDASGEKYIIAKITPDQATMIQRRMGEHIQQIPVELPPDPAQHQTALFRIGPIREFYERYLSGRRRQ